MDSTTRRDQQATCSRKRFTKDVIRAIEALELRRSNLSDEELADSAWQKLQFDLPVVEPRELAALVDRLRSTLKGKVGWPCYALTSKALENITNGAKRGSSFKPELPEHEQQLQRLLSDAISASVKPRTPQNSKLHQQHQASQVNSSTGSADQQQGHTLQDWYQQLCAVVLLQYVGKVISLSEQDGWQLLQDYQPEHDAAQHSLEQQRGRQQAEGGQIAHCSGQLTDQELVDALLQHEQPSTTATDSVPAHIDPSLLATHISAANRAAAAEAARPSIYEQSESTVQDLDGDDDEMYEPLDPVQLGNNSFCSTPQHQASAQQQPYSWPDLRRKLLSVSGHVQYSILNSEYLWQQQTAAQHVLQVLRAVGVHTHAVELQPLVHAYAGLLIDRIAVHPGDLPLLQHFWEALGLTGQGLFSNSGLRGSQSGRSPGGHHQIGGLPTEAVLGLTAAASVWQQVTGSGSRSKLWRLMFDNLLQLLEQCTEQLAYSSGGSSRSASLKQSNSGMADTNGGITHLQQDQASQGDLLAQIRVVSHIIELLVLVRPATIDVAGQLTQLGVTRNLVQLFKEHGTNDAAEALRRAVLLSCCSSQLTSRWVIAVPAVVQQLQQPVYQLSGAAEAHGALWQLILHRDQKSLTDSTATKAGARAGPAAAGTTAQQGISPTSQVDCPMLLQLLEMGPDSVQQLQRQLILLQLMADAQKAAGKRCLWDDTITSAVKQLAARLKHLQTSEAQATAASTDSAGNSVVTVEAGTACANSILANGTSNTCDNDIRELQKLQRHGSAAARESIEHRQLQQLCSTASKLVKELLTQGGKTD